MNVFQLNYEARLANWYELRTELEHSDMETKCVRIDNWWQKAPLVNNHLHLLDSESWPDPWQLLVENTYDEVARALGMCYTLLLLGVENVEIADATNDMGDDVIIVLVDNAKYVMNYYPNMVLSISSQDFNIKRKVSLDKIKTKI